MTSYKIHSVKTGKDSIEVKGSITDAIRAAVAHDKEYQPSYGTDVYDASGEKVFETHVTDDDIRELREESLAADDYAQVDLCNRALSKGTTDQDGNQIALADMSQDHARSECERVILEARGEAAAAPDQS